MERWGHVLKAIRHNDLEAFKSLVPSLEYCDNDYNEHYCLPLIMQASHRGKLQIVEHLLSIGVNVDEPTKISKRTSLSFAAELGFECVCKRLLQAGANPNAVAIKQPPLYFALKKRQIKTSKLLLDYGADISIIKVPLNEIPREITLFIGHRKACRRNAILLMGIRKYLSSKEQDVNVFRLVGKHVWSLRMESPISNVKAKKLKVL